MTTEKTKRPSVLERIRTFFENNPSEELTLDQIVKKFNTTEGHARNILVSLKSEGFIARVVLYRKQQP
jgi:Fic family protein